MIKTKNSEIEMNPVLADPAPERNNSPKPRSPIRHQQSRRFSADQDLQNSSYAVELQKQTQAFTLRGRHIDIQPGYDYVDGEQIYTVKSTELGDAGGQALEPGENRPKTSQAQLVVSKSYAR